MLFNATKPRRYQDATASVGTGGSIEVVSLFPWQSRTKVPMGRSRKKTRQQTNDEILSEDFGHRFERRRLDALLDEIGNEPEQRRTHGRGRQHHACDANEREYETAKYLRPPAVPPRKRDARRRSLSHQTLVEGGVRRGARFRTPIGGHQKATAHRQAPTGRKAAGKRARQTGMGPPMLKRNLVLFQMRKRSRAMKEGTSRVQKTVQIGHSWMI